MQDQSPWVAATIDAAEAHQVPDREQIGVDHHALEATIDSLRHARLSKARLAKSAAREPSQRPTPAL